MTEAERNGRRSVFIVAGSVAVRRSVDRDAGNLQSIVAARRRVGFSQYDNMTSKQKVMMCRMQAGCKLDAS